MTDSVGFFDLVKTSDGDRYTVVAAPKDGLALLTKNTWPIEFTEIEGHKAPNVVVLAVEKLEIVCSGKHRLTVFADLLREHADKSAADQGLDWDDVNAAVFEAAKILPSHLIDIDLETGDWKLHDVVPAELVLFVKPAAILIATHAHGRGEADAGAVTEAYEAARLVPESFTRSADTSPKL